MGLRHRVGPDRNCNGRISQDRRYARSSNVRRKTAACCHPGLRWLLAFLTTPLRQSAMLPPLRLGSGRCGSHRAKNRIPKAVAASATMIPFPTDCHWAEANGILPKRIFLSYRDQENRTDRHLANARQRRHSRQPALLVGDTMSSGLGTSGPGKRSL